SKPKRRSPRRTWRTDEYVAACPDKPQCRPPTDGRSVTARRDALGHRSRRNELHDIVLRDARLLSLAPLPSPKNRPRAGSPIFLQTRSTDMLSAKPHVIGRARAVTDALPRPGCGFRRPPAASSFFPHFPMQRKENPPAHCRQEPTHFYFEK